jgi:type I restriction enzyme R subunit
MRRTLRRQFSAFDDFRRRWTAAERKQAVLGALRDQGLPLAVPAQAVSEGEKLDAFDLIAHAVFDGADKFSEALTEPERQLHKESA